jgi:hypothetical protein
MAISHVQRQSTGMSCFNLLQFASAFASACFNMFRPTLMHHAAELTELALGVVGCTHRHPQGPQVKVQSRKYWVSRSAGMKDNDTGYNTRTHCMTQNDHIYRIIVQRVLVEDIEGLYMSQISDHWMTIGRGSSIETPLAIPPRIHVVIQGEPLQRLGSAGGVTTGIS